MFDGRPTACYLPPMRKLSVAVIASFATLVVATGMTAGGTLNVGGAGPGDAYSPLNITKVVAGQGGTLPQSWIFTVATTNCEVAIDDGQGGFALSRDVTVVAAGGTTSVLVRRTNASFNVGEAQPIDCVYTVTEQSVAGWTVTPASPQQITVGTGGASLTFTNTALATTTTSTSPTSTSTTTTSVGATTTTAATTTTSVAIAGTLPQTGSNSSTRNAALIASGALLLGFFALAAARRRPAV